MPNTPGGWNADRDVPMLDPASDLCLIGLGGLNTCIPPAEIKELLFHIFSFKAAQNFQGMEILSCMV